MAYAEVAGLPAGRRAVGDRRPAARLRRARLLAAAVGRARVHDGADDGGRGRADRGRRPGALRRPGRGAVPAWSAVLCVLGWVGRLGFLADLLSKPVLVGYMAGIAAIMVASQLGKLTGIDVDADSFVSQVGYVAGHLDEVHGPTAGARRRRAGVAARRQPPVPAIAHAPGRRCCWPPRRSRCSTSRPAGSPSSGRFRPDCRPRRCPLVSAADLGSLLLPAVGVAIVAYSDNVLTARAFATRNRYEIDSNQELLALGRREPGVRCDAGLPGEQQRQPHGDRRLARQPQPAVLAGRPRRPWS